MASSLLFIVAAMGQLLRTSQGFRMVLEEAGAAITQMSPNLHSVEERKWKKLPFVVTLLNRKGDGLGLTVDFADTQTLVIDKIKDGLVKDWNEAHTSQRVEVGDRIRGINGVTGDTTAMLAQVQGNLEISLIIEREENKSDIAEANHTKLHMPVQRLQISERDDVTDARKQLPEAFQGLVEYDKAIGKGSFGRVYRMKVKCDLGASESPVVALKFQYYRGDINKSEATALAHFGTPEHRNPFVTSVIGGLVGTQVEVLNEIRVKQNGRKIITKGSFNLMEFMNMGEMFDNVIKYFPTYGEFGGRAAFYALLIHVLKGLRAIHEEGLVHLDMKLENVLMNCNMVKDQQRCFAQVIDLGFISRQDRGLGGLKGTPTYFAPEFIKDMDELKPHFPTPLNDVFAVGIMFYFMHFGAFPDYDAEIDGRNYSSVLRWTPETDSRLGGCTPPETAEEQVTNIICGMTQPDPAKRTSGDDAITAIESMTLALAAEDLDVFHVACGANVAVHRVKQGSSKNKCPPRPNKKKCPRRNEEYCFDDPDSGKTGFCCCSSAKVESEGLRRLNKTTADGCGSSPEYTELAQKAANVVRTVAGYSDDPVRVGARKAIPACLEQALSERFREERDTIEAKFPPIAMGIRLA